MAEAKRMPFWVIFGVYPVLLAFILWLYQQVYFLPVQIPPKFLSSKSTLELAIKCSAISTIPIFYLIIIVMLCRILTAAGNVLKEYQGIWFKVHSMCLQNTLEQNFLFAVNLIAIGAFEGLAPEKIVLVTGIYIVSRVLFYLGYIAAGYTGIPAFRSVWMMLTFVNNGFLLWINVKTIFKL
ncbi:unnamed protein product [Blepharisma stoltei]|uniref:MAPEG family protein n=1 Tax=Blepharisma stoltei TaxID=1481888 RepID=A0AAU9J537_9CILI|nr:unnamed protein product [Blepharisma stoltei]